VLSDIGSLQCTDKAHQSVGLTHSLTDAVPLPYAAPFRSPQLTEWPVPSLLDDTPPLLWVSPWLDISWLITTCFPQYMYSTPASCYLLDTEVFSIALCLLSEYTPASITPDTSLFRSSHFSHLVLHYVSHSCIYRPQSCMLQYVKLSNVWYYAFALSTWRFSCESSAISYSWYFCTLIENKLHMVKNIRQTLSFVSDLYALISQANSTNIRIPTVITPDRRSFVLFAQVSISKILG